MWSIQSTTQRHEEDNLGSQRDPKEKEMMDRAMHHLFVTCQVCADVAGILGITFVCLGSLWVFERDCQTLKCGYF